MRFGWLALAAFFVSTSSFASIETQLKHCQNINDKLERLVCYDNLATSVVPKSVTATPSPRVSSSTLEDDFGRVKPKADAISRLSLTVASVTKSPYGSLRIRFNNGQSWKQIDSRRFRLRKGDTVYIKKGALGSFLLGMNGRNTTIRVKREK